MIRRQGTRAPDEHGGDAAGEREEADADDDRTIGGGERRDEVGRRDDHDGPRVAGRGRSPDDATGGAPRPDDGDDLAERGDGRARDVAVRPRWPRRALVALALAVVGYPLLLLAAGPLLEGLVAERIRARLAASMQARVDLRALDLDLVRGAVVLHDLRLVREERGVVTITIPHASLRFAALGALLVERDVRRVAARDVTVVITAAGLVDLAVRPSSARPPLPIGELVLDRGALAITATSGLPLVGRAEVKIAHARTGAFDLQNGLSWVFSLHALEAQVALPVLGTTRLDYTPGALTLAGGPLGEVPLVVQFEMPPPPPGDELDALQALVRPLGGGLLRGAIERQLLKRLLGD